MIQTKASHSMEQHLTRQKNMLRAQVEKSIHKNTQITRIIRLLSSNLALSRTKTKSTKTSKTLIPFPIIGP